MFAGLIAGLIAFVGLALSPAAAGIFESVPDVILCPYAAIPDRPGGLVVFYVEARRDDGTAVYKTLGISSIKISVSADGMVKAGKLAECDGKTIKELRDAGRAFDLR